MRKKPGVVKIKGSLLGYRVPVRTLRSCRRTGPCPEAMSREAQACEVESQERWPSKSPKKKACMIPSVLRRFKESIETMDRQAQTTS